MKKARNHLFVFLLLVVVFAFSAHSVYANSHIASNGASGINGGNNVIDFSPPSKLGLNDDITPNSVVRFAINGLVVVGIIASLIWLLYGGIRWVISGGDKAKVDAARGAIVAAIVGLIIVILAWVIINAVLVIITGDGISSFTLPSLKNPEGN